MRSSKIVQMDGHILMPKQRSPIRSKGLPNVHCDIAPSSTDSYPRAITLGSWEDKLLFGLAICNCRKLRQLDKGSRTVVSSQMVRP